MQSPRNIFCHHQTVLLEYTCILIVIEFIKMRSKKHSRIQLQYDNLLRVYTLWHYYHILMSSVALFDILKVLLDHLDKPYSDCLVNLRDQEHVDAYQEIHGTNYSMRVMSTQNYCNCNQI